MSLNPQQNPVHRPTGVTFLLALALIAGGFTALTGGIMFFSRRSDEVQASTGLDQSEILWVSLLIVAVGVLLFLVAGALGQGHEWARLLVGVLAAISLVTHVFVLFRSGYASTVMSSVVSIGIDALVLYLLFNRRANEFFEAGSG